MKSKFTKMTALLLALGFGCAAFAACGETPGPDGPDGPGSGPGTDGPGPVGPGGEVTVPDLNNGYTYTKENNEGLMQFYSSDPELDDFLNDYMRRHLRYDDEAIGDLKIGDGSTVWKEWETMSVAWMNTAGIGYSPMTKISSWFSNIYQDLFGYIWVDKGVSTASDWGQSWEFPNWSQSCYYVDGHKEFLNYSYLNQLVNLGETSVNAKNAVNPLDSLWTGVATTNGGDTIVGTLGKNTTEYYDYIAISGQDIRSVVYTYETPEKNAEGKRVIAQGPHKGYEVKDFMGTPFCSPFLELDFSILDKDSLGLTNQVEDIIVSWKGGSGEKNKEWDEKHSVRYSEFSSNYREQFASTTHIVFPMFANPYWGKSASLDDAITDMKIEVLFKNGINADIRLEEVTLAFDGRQVNNNSVFIAAAAYYYRFTQDDAWLAQNLDKIRRAMQFLLTYCATDSADGADVSALMTTKNLVGHDGSSNYDFWNNVPITNVTGDYTAVGRGIGDGYWDCPSNPCINIYTNTYFYKALTGMKYLEEMADASGIEESGESVTVHGPDWTTVKEYNETAESLQRRIDSFLTQFRSYFWSNETGRFVLGYLDDNDPGLKAGKVTKTVDYGFTTYNQEIVELGIATEEQAKSIQAWINGERVVEGDDADNSGKGNTQIYRFEFAPRWTTKSNRYQFWYRFNGIGSGSYGWNKQVQNGGTALHCAYYDLTAEKVTGGTEGAFAKLRNIETWYQKVVNIGGYGKEFYREYYSGDYMEEGGDNVKLQGGSGAGVLGMDYEFIEASLLFTSVPEVFFGLGSTEYKTLNVTPALPSGLSFWKMENLLFAGLEYDLTIGENWIQINSVQGDTEGKKVKVTLTAPDGTFEVRQHNKILTQGTDYVVEGGKVIVTALFRNGRIQIVKK